MTRKAEKPGISVIFSERSKQIGNGLLAVRAWLIGPRGSHHRSRQLRPSTRLLQGLSGVLVVACPPRRCPSRPFHCTLNHRGRFDCKAEKPSIIFQSGHRRFEPMITNGVSYARSPGCNHRVRLFTARWRGLRRSSSRDFYGRISLEKILRHFPPLAPFYPPGSLFFPPFSVAIAKPGRP
jgi:hypothetical protein